MCDLITVFSIPGNCFLTFGFSLFLIILTLGVGSSHVSKQSPWQISSSRVSLANDPNCLWSNPQIPWDRLWGPASVTALFGHSPALFLGSRQPLRMSSVSLQPLWLCSLILGAAFSPPSFHSLRTSLPWGVSSGLSLRGKMSTANANHAKASRKHLLHADCGGGGVTEHEWPRAGVEKAHD